MLPINDILKNSDGSLLLVNDANKNFARVVFVRKGWRKWFVLYRVARWLWTGSLGEFKK